MQEIKERKKERIQQCKKNSQAWQFLLHCWTLNMKAPQTFKGLTTIHLLTGAMFQRAQGFSNNSVRTSNLVKLFSLNFRCLLPSHLSSNLLPFTSDNSNATAPKFKQFLCHSYVFWKIFRK